ncbi:MAG: PLD nuclease N-terminal domain-containing protein, partial [Wenzhouxiangellaceae bacterium]|nr:PLD nuclease N-terminal domain-containing protein [Wenzhouxiangellaceae bacterium]
MLELLADPGFVAAALHAVMAPIAVLHAMLFKRDPRAALGWIAVAAMVPVAGPLLYALIGINRIRRRAREVRWPRLSIGHERGRALSEGGSLPGELPADLAEFA